MIVNTIFSVDITLIGIVVLHCGHMYLHGSICTKFLQEFLRPRYKLNLGFDHVVGGGGLGRTNMYTGSLDVRVYASNKARVYRSVRPN